MLRILRGDFARRRSSVGMSERAVQDALTMTARRFAAAPAFPQAVRRFSEGYVEFRQGPKLFSKLLARDVSWRVIGYLLFLHADHAQFGSGGATYSRLLELCSRRNEVSRRTLKTMLALLRLAGFIQADINPADRRVKIYRPTERMLGFVRRWLSYPVAALDILEPELKRSQSLQSDPGFIERFLVSGGRQFTTATPPTERVPELSFFAGGPENAFLILVVVRLAEMQGVPIESRAEIARRFGLSKTQVTRVLSGGAERGFFFIDDNGVPAGTPAVRALYDHWVALELAFYAENMRPDAGSRLE
jgi:hypothetical protein